MTRRALVVRVAAAAIGLLLASVVAELAVRGYATVNAPMGHALARHDPFRVKIVPLGELGYKQKPNTAITYRNGTVAAANALGFRGPTIETPKPEGHFRILLLGGSTTHGWGVADTATIDRYMRDAFRRQMPDRTVEVANLAFDGYDAYQLYERLRGEGLAYEPDVIVVNSGINDVRNARIENLVDRDRRTLIWETELQRLREEAERGRPRFRQTLRHYSYTARLVSLVRNRQSRSRGPLAETRASPNEVVSYPEAADNFALNLGRIADLATQHGIRLVFSTPPSSLNLRYAPTAKSGQGYWLQNAAATQIYRDTLAGRMLELVGELEARHHPVAYLGLNLPAEMFLDDCHLTPAGNRTMADALVETITPWITGD